MVNERSPIEYMKAKCKIYLSLKYYFLNYENNGIL